MWMLVNKADVKTKKRKIKNSHTLHGNDTKKKKQGWAHVQIVQRKEDEINKRQTRYIWTKTWRNMILDWKVKCTWQGTRIEILISQMRSIKTLKKKKVCCQRKEYNENETSVMKLHSGTRITIK